MFSGHFWIDPTSLFLGPQLWGAVNPFESFLDNVQHNLFKPLLLFFYLGFLAPILKVKFEFPQALYQGLVIYLLVSIGWEGGERLATLDKGQLTTALGFMLVGFATNFVLGILAYLALRAFTNLRQIDAATVAGYYGSDSAGTFATAKGVLLTAHLAFLPYMPVMLAVMEIPGCLVALYLVSTLRRKGMDAQGHMPSEAGYDPGAKALPTPMEEGHGHGNEGGHGRVAVEKVGAHVEDSGIAEKPKGIFSPELLHEVFLNPGLFLLFGGILIGFLSGLQGEAVTQQPNAVFTTLFQGMLCLFLLEMGMTASRHLRDLQTAGWKFILFALVAPNVFATIGMIVAHLYSHLTGADFQVGTYVMFAVLCGAASYIAVPAVQRLAIPEASPTLPLAASLGVTFTYNVTIGIPVYIEVSKFLMTSFPT